MPSKEMIKNTKFEVYWKTSSTAQLGELVKNEIDKVRKSLYEIRSAIQAIAIGFSEISKRGIKIPPFPRANRETPKPTAPISTPLRRNKVHLNAMAESKNKKN